MSGHVSEGSSGGRRPDPVGRFFIGCVLVLAGFAALVVVGALLIGWRLARDEAAGRPQETFLVGDEGRYWCIELKPQDAGLAALLARFDEINDATRRDVLRGTFLESIPFPKRGLKLDEFAPFTLEFSTASLDGTAGWPLSTGWAARGTFSHGLFRLRAAFKVISFVVSREPTKGVTKEIDGITVTEIRDNDLGFAAATVGNRLLVASDAERLRAVLQAAPVTPTAAGTDVLALHDAIRLPGEDAWAFYSNRGPDGGAVASFDVNERDELAFRVVVSPGSALEGGNDFAGTPSDGALVVSRLLPGVPVDAITIDGGRVRADRPGSTEFSGRVVGLSTRFAELVSRVTENRRSETPFATPIRPFLQRPVDPQSGTAAEPTREEIPMPRR